MFVQPLCLALNSIPHAKYEKNLLIIPVSLLFQTVLCTGMGTDQNFIIGCWYFLKKSKLPVQTKTLLFVAGIFLVVLFPCDILVICFCPTYRVMV